MSVSEESMIVLASSWATAGVAMAATIPFLARSAWIHVQTCEMAVIGVETRLASSLSLV